MKEIGRFWRKDRNRKDEGDSGGKRGTERMKEEEGISKKGYWEILDEGKRKTRRK